MIAMSGFLSFPLFLLIWYCLVMLACFNLCLFQAFFAFLFSLDIHKQCFRRYLESKSFESLYISNAIYLPPQLIIGLETIFKLKIIFPHTFKTWFFCHMTFSFADKNYNANLLSISLQTKNFAFYKLFCVLWVSEDILLSFEYMWVLLCTPPHNSHFILKMLYFFSSEIFLTSISPVIFSILIFSIPCFHKTFIG